MRNSRPVGCARYPAKVQERFEPAGPDTHTEYDEPQAQIVDDSAARKKPVREDSSSVTTTQKSPSLIVADEPDPRLVHQSYGYFGRTAAERIAFIAALTVIGVVSDFSITHQIRKSDENAARQKADEHAMNLERINEESKQKEAQAAIERERDIEEAKRLAEAESQRQKQLKDIWKQETLVIGREYEVQDDTLSEISESEPRVYRVRFEPDESGSRFHVNNSNSRLTAKDWIPLKGDIFPPVFVSEVKKEVAADGEEVIVVMGAGHLGLKPGRSYWTKTALLQACRDLVKGKPVQYKIKRDNPEASDMEGFITPDKPVDQ